MEEAVKDEKLEGYGQRVEAGGNGGGELEEGGDFEGETGSEGQGQVEADEVGRLRGEVATAVERLAAVYRERADVVPELIMGSSVAALDAALVVAQQAYANLMARSGQGQAAGEQRAEGRISGRVVVAAGGGERRSGSNAAGLSAVQKIALGLEQRMR